MRHAIAALVAVITLQSVPSAWGNDEAITAPVFRPGLWEFSSITRQPTKPGSFFTNATHVKYGERSTRCVDPSINMKTIFAGEAVGNCQPSKPVKTTDGYLVGNRCDYKGMVRTEITVVNDEAYTESNENLATKRKDVVVAQRVGDCN